MKTYLTLATLLLLTGTAMAQTSTSQTPLQQAQDTVSMLKEACQNEMTTYCKDVSPGEGRLFACLYAYTDKLSTGCERALYNTATELEYAISKLNYVANACATDLVNFCTGTEPGEGRIADCLKNNMNRLSDTCQQAVQSTGMSTK